MFAHVSKFEFMSLPRRFFLVLIVMAASGSAGFAADGLRYYKWLRSLEGEVVDAVRKRSAADLARLHATLLEDGKIGKPAPFCSTASAHLAAAAVVYAGMFDPRTLGPSTTPSDSAEIGDRTWVEYLILVRRCEQSVGVLAEARRPRLSDLLR